MKLLLWGSLCNQITHIQDAPTITEEKQNQHYDTDSSGVDYESATDDDETEHTLIHDDINSDHECEEDDFLDARLENLMTNDQPDHDQVLILHLWFVILNYNISKVNWPCISDIRSH